MSSKIVLIGDSGVGKSSILQRYIMNVNCDMPSIDTFNRLESTIGAAYYTLQLERNKLQIWDTAGQERFRSICPIYFRGSSGCICTFDVTNRDSFDNIDYWIGSYRNVISNSNILLLANKTDYPVSKWQVDYSEILAKSHDLDCEFICTSAINMTNFVEFCNYIKTTYNDPPSDIPLPAVDNKSYCNSCL